MVAIFFLQGLIVAAVTALAAKRRGLAKRATWIWMALGASLGWGVPLAVLACYPRIVHETCTRCQKPRRIDLPHCPHCQASWDKPQREGIEIIEHEFDTLGRSVSVTG